MPEHAESRNVAGVDGGESGDLADKVRELERKLELMATRHERMAVRQRAVMQVVAAGHGLIFREIEALLKG